MRSYKFDIISDSTCCWTCGCYGSYGCSFIGSCIVYFKSWEKCWKTIRYRKKMARRAITIRNQGAYTNSYVEEREKLKNLNLI